MIGLSVSGPSRCSGPCWRNASVTRPRCPARPATAGSSAIEGRPPPPALCGQGEQATGRDAGLARRRNRMTVRDLPCWPPNWRAVATGASHGAKGERGVLMAARKDLRAQTLTLTMEDAGDRYVAVLHDDPSVVTGLTLLLDWHLGRPLAQIARLEVRV